MSNVLDKLRSILGAQISTPIPRVLPTPAYEAPLARMKNQVLAVGLRRLFTQNYFCIIDFDNLTKLAGVIVDGEVHQALRVLHCVNWRDMPKDLREEVQRTCLAALASEVRP